MEKYTVITKDGKAYYFGTDIDKVIAYDRSKIKEVVVELWLDDMWLCNTTMTPYDFFVENLGLEI